MTHFLQPLKQISGVQSAWIDFGNHLFAKELRGIGDSYVRAMTRRKPTEDGREADFNYLEWFDEAVTPLLAVCTLECHF